MLYLLCLITFSYLFSYCRAVCCNNYNALCLVNAITCTPNCDDGISLCDCPAACLNDDFGGCNTDYQCSSPNDGEPTVTVTEETRLGFATSIVTSYSTTITSYYSTVTSYNIISEEDTYYATSTYVDTETSTTFTTVPGPTATITRRSFQDNQIPQPGIPIVTATAYTTSPAGARVTPKALFDRRIAKRTVTVYVTTTNPSNFCDNDGYPDCTYTSVQALVYNLVATTTEDTTTYDYVTSYYYSTITSYYYVTSTITADGYTTTVANPDEDTPTTTSEPPTSSETPTPSESPTSSETPTTSDSSSSEGDVTVTDNGTDVFTATAVATGGAGGGSESDVVVTNRQTATATATAVAAGAIRLVPDTKLQAATALGLLLWRLFLHAV